MKKNRFWSLLAIVMVAVLSITFASCDKKENYVDNEISIVGKWVDGHKIMELGKDGSYHSYQDNGDQYSHREGTYSYNPAQSLFVVNVPASTKNGNSAYTRTLIVQTLTRTTLVLLYTDGDAQGYYTRK